MLKVFVYRASNEEDFQIFDIKESDFFNFINKIVCQTESRVIVDTNFTDGDLYEGADGCTVSVQIYDCYIE